MISYKHSRQCQCMYARVGVFVVCAACVWGGWLPRCRGVCEVDTDAYVFDVAGPSVQVQPAHRSLR